MQSVPRNAGFSPLRALAGSLGAGAGLLTLANGRPPRAPPHATEVAAPKTTTPHHTTGSPHANFRMSELGPTPEPFATQIAWASLLASHGSHLLDHQSLPCQGARTKKTLGAVPSAAGQRMVGPPSRQAKASQRSLMSVNTPHPLPPDSPEALHPLLRFLRFARRPLERFFQIEAASGILLLVTAALALGWANSPWASSYQHLWHTPFGFALGAFAVEKTLAWFVNDGLMVLFFFVVGLEIRREIHRGELSEWRRAALPVAAALGGMLAPAGLYLLLAGEAETHSGWGVPMATDIAFAVGILMLLGKRVPPALRVLLLAVAVIDDLGAIVVIALFYSSGIQPLGLLVAATGFGAIVAMQRAGVRSKLFYGLPAVVVWAGIYAAGVHPTIAGVLVGLITPVLASDGEVPPSESLITTLHPWVAFGIMPVFALANAGVTLSGGSFGPFATNVLNAVAVGLVLGKPLGILSACWLALRLRIGTLPLGLTFRHLLVLGVVAGVGFTMALFIAQLAFVNAELLAAAKLGVLVASACAAVLAFGLGRVLLLPVAVVGAAQSEDEAESSTEK